MSQPPRRISSPCRPRSTGAVRGVHAAAPLFVGLGNLESQMLSRRLADERVDRPVYICGLAARRDDDHAPDAQRASRRRDPQIRRFPDALHAVRVEQVFPKIPVDAMRKPVPRIHRDRIQVTRDSAEMGEEILWEHFFPYIHDEDRSTAYSIVETSNPAFERFYDEHLRKLLLSRGRTRYVSKAIMCVMRMQYLRKMFPDARFLLYVRNPVDHVASLLKQDRIWDELDNDDPRQIEIIELTGHHEFGSRQIMANVGDSQVLEEIHRLRDEGRTVRARARYWAYMYDFVLKQIASDPNLERAVCTVRYEDLCGNSPETIDRIVAHIDVNPQKFAQTKAAYTAKLSLPDYYRPKFDDRELADIVEVTGDVADRFGYDVAAIAARAAAPPAEQRSPA